MAHPQVSGIFFEPGEYINDRRKITCFCKHVSYWGNQGLYCLPLTNVSAKATLISTSSHLSLVQTFQNPSDTVTVKKAKYSFPLFPHSAVISFTCHVGEKVIHGVIKPKAQAKTIFNEAVSRGETAGLLQEVTAEIFTVEIGNIPPNTTVKVKIGVISELKSDPEKDTIRYVLPTTIAPRYGTPEPDFAPPGLPPASMDISVEIDMPEQIAGVTAPNQPVSVSLGGQGVGGDSKTIVQLAAQNSSLESDFVCLIKVKKFAKTLKPFALLEPHPAKQDHSAVMVSLVPRLNIPAPPANEKPEVIFIADLSGSMTGKMPQLRSALEVFLKSLPASGIKFNIVSFGNKHRFLYTKGSQTYNADTLREAVEHVRGFRANMGGTELYRALEAAFESRYKDIENTEIILLTDGEVWNTEEIFNLIRTERAKYKDGKGPRIYSLGIGDSVSHHLVEGIANAGGGFSAFVGENERFESKVITMLKSAMAARIHTINLEIEYEEGGTSGNARSTSKERVVAEKLSDAPQTDAKKKLSLFDADADSDDDDAREPARESEKFTTVEGADRYSHLRQLTPPNPIQTPAIINSVHPGQRLLVYLLFRPAEKPRTPKSITLKAKLSTGDEVELKIPCTTIPPRTATENGSLVHLLAARNLIKDMEDGKSWLELGASGVNREDNPGRFDEYVAREAEKIGLEWGIVSKWTSFVAVEKKPEGQQTRSRSEAKAAGEQDDDFEMVDAAECYEATGGSRGGEESRTPASPSNLYAGRMVSERDRSRPSFSTGPPAQLHSVMAYSGAPLIGSSGPNRRKRASAPSQPAMESFGAPSPQQQQQGLSQNSFGAAPVAYASASLFGSAAIPSHGPSATRDRDRNVEDNFGSNMFSDRAQRGHNAEAAQSKKFRYKTFSSSHPSKQRRIDRTEGRKPPQALMELIVDLQDFDGRFKSSDSDIVAVENALGVSSGGFKSAFSTGKLGTGKEVQMTALCIAILKKYCAEQADVWEMIVDKAESWLQEQGVKVADIVEKATALLSEQVPNNA